MAVTKCTVINWRPMSEFPKDSDDEFLFLVREGRNYEMILGYYEGGARFNLRSGVILDSVMVDDDDVVAWCPKPDFSQFDEVKP